MARAGAVLGEPTYRAAAEKNLAFLQAKLWDAKTKTLYHRWRDGERDEVQLLEAYAFLLAGVIELYEATLEPKHLDFAIALAEAMLARFYDAENGGFWQSPPGAKDLILRVKEDYDGAEPSGNSVAILALLKLGRITEPQGLHAGRPRRACACSPTASSKLPRPSPSCSRRWISRSTNPGARWSPATRPTPQTRALLRAVHSVYQPNKVVLGNTGRGRAFRHALCPPRAARWSTCAPAPPASRRRATRRRSRSCSGSPPGSDVIHLFLLPALVEQLLEGDRIGGRNHRLLQPLPRAPQFRRAAGVVEAGASNIAPSTARNTSPSVISAGARASK